MAGGQLTPEPPGVPELDADLLNDEVALLQALIRIPSPNPPGDSRAVAAFIAQLLALLGTHVTVNLIAPEAKPQAPSVVASVGTGAPVILLHAHIDTVPVAEAEAARWTTDPYSGDIRDGRIYGKGSIDDKAPLAAMMCAFAAAAHRSAHGLAGTLVLCAAAEEETGGILGTRWMADNGHLPACDFIVVGEQTGNHVASAHKGVLRATVRAVGRSVHATDPDRGVNAIVAMARAVLALDFYHQSLRARTSTLVGVPSVGVPTCNVGVIAGGSTANAVPDSCAAFLDRRMIPGEDPQVVMHELEAVIAGVGADAAVGAATLSVGDYQVSNWFASTVAGDLAQVFLGCVRAVLGEAPGPIGYLPGSDAKHLTGCLQPGGEMIIFGPGSYEVAHAFDEYTEIADLHATRAILEQFIAQTMSQENEAGA